MKRLFKLFVAAIFALFMFVGCSDSEDEKSVEVDALVGTWESAYVDESGVAHRTVFVFRADNTGYAERFEDGASFGSSPTFTWSRNGGIVTIMNFYTIGNVIAFPYSGGDTFVIAEWGSALFRKK